MRRRPRALVPGVAGGSGFRRSGDPAEPGGERAPPGIRRSSVGAREDRGAGAPPRGRRRCLGRGAYGEKDTVSGISVMPLYFSIARFMRFSLWPSRLFHSAHQLRKFLKVSSSSERMPK